MTRELKPGRVSPVDPIEVINGLSCTEFEQQYARSEWINPRSGPIAKLPLNVLLKPSPILTKLEIDQCLELIASSSRKDYEHSSVGWHPRRKRTEMTDPAMRYVLLCNSESQDVQGFLSFMFTFDSTPPTPVTYVYEIHLAEVIRGQGLGTHLMQVAEDIARRARMSKVMLTCFPSNTFALDFYHRIGYIRDASSPKDRQTRNRTIKADYLILSKSITLRASTPASSSAVTVQD